MPSKSKPLAIVRRTTGCEPICAILGSQVYAFSCESRQQSDRTDADRYNSLGNGTLRVLHFDMPGLKAESGAFKLPANARRDGTSASYAEGVLELTVEKRVRPSRSRCE